MGRVTSFSRDAALALGALAVLAIIPLVLPSAFFTDLVIRLSAMALFATSLNLLVGTTGLVSFGHGMFYGLGAYAFALLMQDTMLPLWAAALLTLAIAAVAAGVVGAICIRLRTIYFAFVTLAMQMLLHSVILSWVSLTGGDQGLRGGIPRRVFAGVDLANQRNLYWASAVLLVGGLLLMRHIVSTPFGTSLRMVRDNETRAAFLGIVVWRAKLAVFVLAGVFAALGGIVASLFVSGAYPELADWPISGQAIFAIVLGGINAFLGPLVGAAILLGLNDVVTRETEYYGLALGVIILLFALGLRRGVTDFVLEQVRRARPRLPAARSRGVRPT
ncbi:MAG: branched-chain amino acid ABC transporter permease [Pseudomonadota bacterium]|nr:branched-chain amino acid ABC transporter permease [Pseudomonadota bacterium]